MSIRLNCHKHIKRRELGDAYTTVVESGPYEHRAENMREKVASDPSAFRGLG